MTGIPSVTSVKSMGRPLRILVTGGGGMLARDLISVAGERGHEVHATGVEALDITDEEVVRETIGRLSPDVVLNAAAYTNVDGAEADEEAADRVNRLGPHLLARACSVSDALLVHFSTDYVFGPGHTSPIPVDAPCAPQNVYGWTKLAGERAIHQSGVRSLILRTSWLYAGHGRNFVNTMLHLGRERSSLRVVNDQVGRPTYTRDLACATLGLIACQSTGVFHVANGGSCSWFDFASTIFKIADISCALEPCTSDAFPRPAHRPAYSVLDLSQVELRLGPMPTWEDALRRCLATMETTNRTRGAQRN